LSISTDGELTTETLNDSSSTSHNIVSDGAWHSLGFANGIITMNAAEIHPGVSGNVFLASLKDRDTTSSTALPHFSPSLSPLFFFDGFVGCIRLSPLLNTTVVDSLHEFFQMTSSPDSRTLCQDFSSIPATCFNPMVHNLCRSCQNGSTCKPKVDDEDNNMCECPEFPPSEDLVYVQPYCELIPVKPVAEAVHTDSSSLYELVDHEGNGPDADDLESGVEDLSQHHSSNEVSAADNSRKMDFDSADTTNFLSQQQQSPSVPTSAFTPTVKIDLEKYFKLPESGDCPCQHGGQCIGSENDVDHYFCECGDSGYEDKYCEKKVTLCSKGRNLCSETSICQVDGTNEKGYECFCRPGFTGEFCDRNFDECLAHDCLNNATCHDLINKFE